MRLYSQSEVQFRALIQGKKEFLDKNKDDPKKVRVFSDYYRVDLNGDGYLEGITIENSDMGSSLHFFKNHFEYFQEVKVSSGGSFSKIDRIEIKNISPNENVMLIYFLEGLAKYLTARSRQRLYVVYIPSKLFDQKFKLDKGPIVFEEFSQKGHYHVKKFDVSVVDLNSDGTKEILIKNRDTEKVMKLDENKRFVLL